MPRNHKPILPLNFGCLNTNFPFIEETFDSLTLLEILKKINCKLNEVIVFIDSVLEQEMNDYINNMFNNMMLDTMYEAETETLILYLKNENQERNN